MNLFYRERDEEILHNYSWGKRLNFASTKAVTACRVPKISASRLVQAYKSYVSQPARGKGSLWAVTILLNK